MNTRRHAFQTHGKIRQRDSSLPHLVAAGNQAALVTVFSETPLLRVRFYLIPNR